MSLEISNVNLPREVVKNTVLKTLRSKVEEINFKLLEASKIMAYYEKKYGLKTDHFYEKFTQGALNDDLDFFEWKALKEIHDELENEKKVLLEAIK
ncbi:MAG: hypothetical protein AB1523_16660 [Bacillota bacterium]